MIKRADKEKCLLKVYKVKHSNPDNKPRFFRLFNSVLGILISLFLLVAGSVLLYWNEGRTLGTNRALVEARTGIVALDPNAALDPLVDGQVVHLGGLASAGTSLFDPLFGVEAQALRLRRSVEYCQWMQHLVSETVTQSGGGEETVINATYEKEWTTYLVNSAVFRDPGFQESNKVLAEVAAQNWLAPEIRLGPYKLPDFLISRLSGEIIQELSLNPEQLAGVANNLGLGHEYIHLVDNALYLGLDPQNPQIGDLRVRFSILPPSEISVIAQVDGDSLTTYTSSAGYEVGELRMGRLSPQEMVEAAKEDSAILNWLLRILSYAAVLFGVGRAYKPISVLVSVLPVTGIIVTYRKVVAVFLLSLLWIILITGLSWLRVRPVLGAFVLALFFLSAFLIQRQKKRRARRAGGIQD